MSIRHVQLLLHSSCHLIGLGFDFGLGVRRRLRPRCRVLRFLLLDLREPAQQGHSLFRESRVPGWLLSTQHASLLRRGVAARLARAHCSRAVRVVVCVLVSAFARGPWLLHFWAGLAPKGCSIR